MKKKTLLIAIPMILMLLAGCAGKAAPETESQIPSESTEVREDTTEEATSPDISSSQEVIPEESREPEMSNAVENLAEEIKPEAVSVAAAEIWTKPKEEPSQPATQPEETKPESPAPSSDTETNDNTPIAEQTEPQESSSQPVTEPEAPSETVVTEPEPEPEPEPKPEPELQPEPVPTFDIDYWISYARGVAAEKGLALDAEATECWDNPITANPDCIYLERDISSRLSRYAREGYTAVWVWYESVGTNKYLIYIGYA